MNKQPRFKLLASVLLAIPLLSLNMFLSPEASAQDITDATPWIWKGGDSTVNQVGHYGTKGVPSVNNIPRARTQAASWTDNSGSFWLFGGRQWGSGVTEAVLNDLWRYNSFNKEWTWISGDSTANGTSVVGTIGTPSTTNTPSARSLTGHWKDNTGNLWLFAGATMSGRLNDLWKFDPVALTWTAVKGDPTLLDIPGVYGTKGTGNISNKPGARSACNGWADNTGNIWVFGGQGLTTNTSLQTSLADLWKYNIATNTWTWIDGSNLTTTASQVANYGVKTVENSTNYPGGRAWSVTWVDGIGNFWMMGGMGIGATTSSGVLNDMWRYNPTTSKWTWMNGANVINNQGTYISKGVSSATRTPRCRFASTAWVDKGGDLWMFGGITINWQSSYVNDIWHYNLSSNEWTWVKGDSTSNVLPIYNTLNVSNIANEIGSRGVEISWRENSNNNVWIFGGQNLMNSSIQTHNDLWKIEACSPIGVLNPISGPDTVCAGDSIVLSDFIIGANTFLWDFPAAWGSQQAGDSITLVPNSNGVVTLKVIGNCGDTSNVQTKTITVSTPIVPVITQTIQNTVITLSVPTIYATYQWSKGGTIIPGATSASYVPTVNGDYSVSVTSTFGCEVVSATFNVSELTSIESLKSIAAISVFPNPVESQIEIETGIPSRVKIIDIRGSLISSTNLSKGQNRIDLSKLASGLYFAEFRSEDGVYIQTIKLIKE